MAEAVAGYPRERAAVHEAAHCALALVLGGQVTSVWVRTTRSSRGGWSTYTLPDGATVAHDAAATLAGVAAENEAGYDGRLLATRSLPHLGTDGRHVAALAAPDDGWWLPETIDWTKWAVRNYWPQTTELAAMIIAPGTRDWLPGPAIMRWWGDAR